MIKNSLIIVFLLFSQLTLLSQTDFDQLINRAYNELDNQNPDEAISLLDQAYDFAKKRKDIYRMVMAKSAMGSVGVQVGDYESSYVNFSDALDYLQKCDTVDLYNKTVILDNLAFIKSMYTDYQMSAVFYKEAYETAKKYVKRFRFMAEENGDLSYLVDLPYSMAIQMKNSGDYEGAGKVLLEMWEDSEYKGDTVSLARALNELGLIKIRNQEFLEAQEFFSFVAFNENIAADTRAIALQNLAVTYSNLNNLETAEKWFKEALAIKLEHSSPRSQFMTMLDLGELEFKKGEVNAAIAQWETAINTFDKINSDPDLFIIYDWLQKAYLRLDPDKSFNYGNLYTSNIQDWMLVQRNQNDNPSLQAFNTKIDVFMRSREEKAERMALIQQFWPAGLTFAVLLTFLIYQIQLFIAKSRLRVQTEKVREIRNQKAQAILDKIRRDA
ncbi:MAG: tetratricopeptide (TPR) repeat protein [Roseivirga sp.]|jgi:tetratricopeptide (TPR) repeat protein